jgi:hypothetical protein
LFLLPFGKNGAHPASVPAIVNTSSRRHPADISRLYEGLDLSREMPE